MKSRAAGQYPFRDIAVNKWKWLKRIKAKRLPSLPRSVKQNLISTWSTIRRHPSPKLPKHSNSSNNRQATMRNRIEKMSTFSDGLRVKIRVWPALRWWNSIWHQKNHSRKVHYHLTQRPQLESKVDQIRLKSSARTLIWALNNIKLSHRQTST